MFYIYSTTSTILIEVFDLFEIEFIRSPTILVYLNNLIEWKRIIVISIFEIVLTYYNDKWRHRLIIRIDILNYSDLFPIIRLYSFSFFTLVVQCYNKGRYNLVYKKVYFIKVLNVGFYNIIFSNYILEKLKSSFNDL